MLKASLVSFDPDFFASLAEGFSALPSVTRTKPSDDTDRNGEAPTEERAKRRSRRERKADPALVASLRAGVDALRAARAKVEREERDAAERAERRADPAWQEAEREREAERRAVRAARAARLERERVAGAKSAELWAARDAWLDKRAKVGWRVVATHEAFPAWGRLVRGYAGSGEIDAARETASIADVFERFVAFARSRLTRAKLTANERAVLERLVQLDPEAFASHALLARTIMDE